MSQRSDLYIFYISISSRRSNVSELHKPVTVISTVSSLRNFISVYVLWIENIESEIIPVKQSLDSTPTAEDLSYSTDDSFEIEPSEDRKKVIHVTATTSIFIFDKLFNRFFCSTSYSIIKRAIFS